MATTFKDYYAILGVPRTATEKEIRTAFRKLARKHHPDVNQGDKAAEDRFKEINEANEVLGDPEKRKKYDELGPRWQEYEQWERAGKPGPEPVRRTAGRAVRLSDGVARRARGHVRQPRAVQRLLPAVLRWRSADGVRPAAAAGAGWLRRGQDVEGDAEISLEDAYTGSALTVDLSSTDGPRRVEVKIPAGIHDGARVRASGQGSAGRGGGPRGDLFIRVHIRPHAAFTRTGDDLAVRVPTPLATAIAGGTVAGADVAGHDGTAVDPCRNAERRSAAASWAGHAASQWRAGQAICSRPSTSGCPHPTPETSARLGEVRGAGLRS